jgi:hypothetical protein
MLAFALNSRYWANSNNIIRDPSHLEVMRRFALTTLAVFARRDLAFDELVGTLKRERSFEPAALAQVVIWLQNVALRPMASSGHKVAPREANPRCAIAPL